MAHFPSQKCNTPKFYQLRYINMKLGKKEDFLTSQLVVIIPDQKAGNNFSLKGGLVGRWRM